MATQSRPVSCNKLETCILVSDWLHAANQSQLDAAEVDRYKRNLKRK